jgi:type III pantothenate kinase
MILLIDIGNTNTHVGLARTERRHSCRLARPLGDRNVALPISDGATARLIVRNVDLPTAGWRNGTAAEKLRQFIGSTPIEGAALCSVVPKATPVVKRAVKLLTARPPVELTAATIVGVGVDYPDPASIGADRLANALAVRHHFGCPSVVVGFGTAVAFDVVSREGNYIGGIIAPGLSAMTDYLHEKTALLPRIKLRDTKSVVGRSTEEAMLIGAVHGYRGLIRELIKELRVELKCRRLPVIATGGYAQLISRSLPEITKVEPLLTLEGLRLFWEGCMTPNAQQ